MKRILFITNGHGEDAVAAQVIRHLDKKGLKIDVLPVVGSGNVFSGSKARVIGPRNILPSGGFGLRNYYYLIRDIFAGFLGKIASQMSTLRKIKGKYDLVVGIGDIVPIVYAMISGARFIFVGVNKSEYYKKLAFNYTGLEKWLLKNYCKLVLTRDKKTSDSLKLLGIKTRYVGNPMMDLVKSGARGQGLGVRKSKTIGFLPGTRDDAYKNIEDFHKVAWQIDQQDRTIKFVMSFPLSLDRKKLAGIDRRPEIRITDDFNEVLACSDVIIGLSGTGNEQAAGSGLPVIAFPGRGAQFNFKFASGQKELLGDALLLLPRDSMRIANEAISLLHDRKRRASMGKAGRTRMGNAGASRKIARLITGELTLK